MDYAGKISGIGGQSGRPGQVAEPATATNPTRGNSLIGSPNAPNVAVLSHFSKKVAQSGENSPPVPVSIPEKRLAWCAALNNWLARLGDRIHVAATTSLLVSLKSFMSDDANDAAGAKKTDWDLKKIEQMFFHCLNIASTLPSNPTINAATAYLQLQW